MNVKISKIGERNGQRRYHEPIDEASDETRNMHRAITSLMEKLEAVGGYKQWGDACKEGELTAMLAHNRDEGKENGAMVLDWKRRMDPVIDKRATGISMG